MHKILSKQIVADQTKRMEIEAPLIAQKAQAGQFVMVMPSEATPRIPLAVTDASPLKGYITVIFKEANTATQRLGAMRIGDELFAVLGPLGVPVAIKSEGVAVGLCYGLGAARLFPICRALRKQENKVIGILSAATKRDLFLESQMRLNCHKLLIGTDDGSHFRRASTITLLREAIANERIDVVYAFAPGDILEAVCRIAKEKRIATVVGVEPPVVDGFGLCGASRIRVNNKDVLASIEGPCFDGTQVDFKSLQSRSSLIAGIEKWNEPQASARPKRKESKISLKSFADLLKNKP